MKLDLLANATVVNDAIMFVSQKSKENLKPSNASEDEKEESNEPDYDKDEQSYKQGKQKTRTHTKSMQDTFCNPLIASR